MGSTQHKDGPGPGLSESRGVRSDGSRYAPSRFRVSWFHPRSVSGWGLGTPSDPYEPVLPLPRPKIEHTALVPRLGLRSIPTVASITPMDR